MAMRAEEYGLVIHEPDGPRDWGTSVPFAYRDREARQLWEQRFDQLSAEVFLGNLRVSSSPLNCLPSSHVARMLHFLMSSFRLLDAEQVVRLTDPSSGDDFFPLSLPDPDPRGPGFKRFSQESWSLYHRAARGQAPALSPLHVEVLSLCDGTRSFRWIADRMAKVTIAGEMKQLVRGDYVVSFASRLRA